MAVAYRSSASVQAQGVGTTLVVPVPAGTVNGDVIVFGVATAIGSSISTPAGLTKLFDVFTGGSEPRLAAFVRVAAGEPASYTFNIGASGDVRIGVASSYTGVDNATPVNVSGGNVNGAASTNFTANSITTTLANCMVVGTYAGRSISQDIVPPAGFTERVEQASTGGGADYRVESCDKLFAASGATGAQAATVAVADFSSAGLVALAPPVAAAQAGWGPIPIA